MSDHLYYLSLKGGGPGDVHSYFNPLSSPVEAFAVYSSVLSDFVARVMRELEKIMDIKVQPDFAKVYIHEKGARGQTAPFTADLVIST